MNNIYPDSRFAAKYRLRWNKPSEGYRYRVMIVSGKNLIHEGFEYKDKRRLKRTLRQLSYIN